MKKQIRKPLQNDTSTASGAALFLSFCRALDKYCEDMGINNRNFSAVRILHSAAGNTILQMKDITVTERRHIAKMEQKIPEMIDGLMHMQMPDGYLETVEKLSTLSLRQLAAITCKNHRQRN